MVSHHESDATVLDGVGAQLRRLRTERGLTLVELAASTGISTSTMSRLENGQRRPTLELLLPILGLISGLLLTLVWAIVYGVAGVDPATSDWALAAPALVAFVIGFCQEWLYGAR